MGFFDNLKSSLAETGQDLSQKAKDTTEIFRLTNLNKTKEKEIEKVIYQIGSTYYANYRDECMEKMPELAVQIKSLQDEIAVNKEMIEKLSTEEICPQCGKKVILYLLWSSTGSTGRTTGGKGRSESVQDLWKATGRGRCILYKLWNKDRRR